MRRIAVTVILALALPTAGCSDARENQGTFLGALGGGIVGSGACLLAHGNALACAAAGIGGAAVGGVIGHVFDERDRARHDAAVRQALGDPGRWQPAARSTSSTASAGGGYDGVGTAPAQATPAARASTRRVASNHASATHPAVAWRNPDTNDSGAIIPLRAFSSPGTGPGAGRVCRLYQESYIRDGKQYSDTMQACPKPDGSGFDLRNAS